MRTRIASLFGLALVAGTLSCAGTASNPPLDTCCVVPTQGTIVCYCGSSTTPGSSFTVVVSGSTCTLTFTSDGGGTNDGGGTSDGGANAPFTGAPPQAQTDCMNPQGG